MGQRDYQYFMSSRKNRFVVNVIYPAQINLMASFAKSSSNLFILVEHICILILAFSYIPTYHFFYFVYPTYAQPTSIFVPWILVFFLLGHGEPSLLHPSSLVYVILFSVCSNLGGFDFVDVFHVVLVFGQSLLVSKCIMIPYVCVLFIGGRVNMLDHHLCFCLIFVF